MIDVKKKTAQNILEVKYYFDSSTDFKLKDDKLILILSDY